MTIINLAQMPPRTITKTKTTRTPATKTSSPKKASPSEQTQPLVGEELIEKVMSMGEADIKVKARACGYLTYTNNKQERVNLMKFYNALMEAEGVDLDASYKGGSRGRTPTFKVSVHKNGNLLIGSAYTKEMGLKPGDEFEIKLGHQHIKLERIDD